MIRRYDKLVRDKIPEIIQSKGEIPRIVKLDDEQYFSALNQKLREEIDEYFEAYELEELADILEVVYAIAQYKQVSKDDLERLRWEKYNERGGFEERIFLLGVEKSE